MTRSTPAGAAVGAACIMAATLIVLWLSGQFQAFNANRGLLQLVVAIPFACLLTGAGLAVTNVLTRRQMLWAMLPVAVLIVLGIGALGPGAAAWPWTLVISAILFVPWMTGLMIGSAIRRHARGPNT